MDDAPSAAGPPPTIAQPMRGSADELMSQQLANAFANAAAHITHVNPEKHRSPALSPETIQSIQQRIGCAPSV
jgi:hypothetical protein